MTEPTNPFQQRLEDVERRLKALEEFHADYWQNAFLSGKIISCGTCPSPLHGYSFIHNLTEHSEATLISSGTMISGPSEKVISDSYYQAKVSSKDFLPWCM